MRSFFSLVGLSALLNFVVTANGVPALYTPLAETLAQASGFSLMAVLMAQVAGYATVVMPYQASPIVVAMGMGQVPARSGLALSLVTALLSFALLVPLDYLWFRLLECWDRDHGVGLGRRFFPGREDAQTMAVRVQRHEGAAEVHVDRRLQDGQAAQAPVAVAVGQGLGVRHGEGQFGGAARPAAAGSTV